MKEKKIELEILERIYQNLIMIKEAILRVIKIQNINENLNIFLKDILKIYQKLIYSVIGMIKNRNRNKNKEEEKIGVISKMATYMSIKINLKKCNNIKDILEMVKQDILIRNEEINTIIKDYNKISKTILNLCNRINIENVKCIKKLENMEFE